MSPPEVRWAASPHDGRCHALEIREAEDAASKGWADAQCGLTLPGAGLAAAEEPHGALCMACVVQVASELPDPGRFGQV